MERHEPRLSSDLEIANNNLATRRWQFRNFPDIVPLTRMAGFYNRFLQTVERYPQVTAVEMQHSAKPGQVGSPVLESYTYSELRRMAESVARWFLGQTDLPDGIKGARCAVLAANGPRWVAAYLGILAAGGVAVPLDTAFTSEQVYKLLADSGTSVLFADPLHLPVAMAAAGRLQIKLVLLEKAADFPEMADLDDMFLAGPADFHAGDVTAGELAVILYTSGTTSDPKGVMLTHGNVDAEAQAVFQFIKVGPADGVLAVLPLFHALAQMANLMLPFAAGAKVVYLDALNTTELVRALRERNITIFACVPQFFYLIHERVMKQVGEKGALEQFGFRLLMQVCRVVRSLGWNLGKTAFAKVHATMGKNLRYFITGGSRFDPEIGRDLESMGFTILQAYGLTETTGAAFITPPGKNIIGSVGQALPGLEARIVFAENLDFTQNSGADHRSPAGGPETIGASESPGFVPQVSADDEPVAGEIVVRGGMVTPGYYHREQATAEVLRDGWFYTGDLGHFDSHHNLFITGRKKDVIVLSSGKNIYPEELEAHYLKSIFIKEICVLGLESKPGEPVSERLHAVVVPDFDVLRERQIVNMGEVIRYDIENLSVDLPATKRILSYDIWQEDLPRTTTRKLKRFQIRNRVMGNGAAGAPSSWSPPAGEPSSSISAEDSLWLSDPQVVRALAIIRAAAKKELRELRPADNLELDLGLDSMERVELLVALESEFGVHLDEGAVAQVYTVRELVEALRAGSGDGARREGFGGWDSVLATDPDDPEVLAIAQDHPVLTPLWFLFGRLVNLFTRDVFHLRIQGLGKLPRRGPFILCPNHQSFLDAPLLVAQLPYSLYQDLFYVGTSEIFGSGAMRQLARSLKLIPVDPDANLVPAMRAGAFGLRQGRVLVMYPEGERSIDGTPKTFKKGAAILSLHLQVPIYPVALDGFFQTWPRGQKFRGPHPLRITIGDPIIPPRSPENPELAYVTITHQLRSAVVEMWRQIHDQEPAASSH